MSVIDQLKEKHNAPTSESLLGIESPPDYQCANINAVIKSLNSIEKKIGNHERMDEDELRDALSWVEHYLFGLEDEVENIRSEIESVRAWGQAWKDLFKYNIEHGHINFEKLSI